ncbi:TadE family protein [Sphingobium aquiterrae]|uniref:TadE/TadG family type IV pilus assembly protein n=1 Tax=Sphingobium aquiterrae TaxID=2038656 RepID=UPI00301ADDE2
MTVGKMHPATAAILAMSKLRRAMGADQSGMAMVEFALSLPFLVALTMGGAEAANLAFAHQKLGDMATLAADSVSRVRVGIGEGDVTDALTGVKLMGDAIKFRNNGRIIISSLQPIVDGSGNVTDEKIRWQRCSGALNATSSYGVQSASLGTTGMGPTGRKIAAAPDTEMIFVEIRYTYQPLISNSFLGTQNLSAIASMVVRERSSNDIQNVGTASPCSTFSA